MDITFPVGEDTEISLMDYYEANKEMAYDPSRGSREVYVEVQNALTGQLYMASDFMGKLPMRKLELYRKTIPPTHKVKRNIILRLIFLTLLVLTSILVHAESKLTANKSYFDFASIREGMNVPVSFKITNTGTKKVKILESRNPNKA